MLLYLGSMEPNLNIGDIVIIKKSNVEDIKKGDIISFRNGQTVITHRVDNIINEESNTKFETKGDNNNSKDLIPVEYEQVEGKLIGRIEKIGNISLFLQNKTAVIVIMFIFFMTYLYSSKKEEKRRQRRIKREQYEAKILEEYAKEVKNIGKEKEED